jgi:hypothetical protein
MWFLVDVAVCRCCGLPMVRRFAEWVTDVADCEARRGSSFFVFIFDVCAVFTQRIRFTVHSFVSVIFS